MNTLSSLVPHKHVRFCDSLIGLAGFLLPLLEESCTPDELWAKLQHKKSGWFGKISFTSMLFAIDILYAIKQIEITEGCRIRRCCHETD
jgi:hypothetical protein